MSENIFRIIFTRRRLHIYAAAISLLLLSTPAAFAGNGAALLVSPAGPDALAYKPLYLSVLTSTELGFSPSPASKAVSQKIGRFSIGSDNYLATDLQIYDIPVSATIYPDLYLLIDLPIISREIKSPFGTFKETGLGDMNLTVKLREEIGDVTDIFYLFNFQLPTGEKDKGLGSGTYDLSVAEKLVTWFGDYRSTFMAGVTVPMLHATVLGSNIKLNPTISYMAAAERSYFRPDLWFGLKVAGEHIFNSRINGLNQPNALTTIDIIPEVTFFSTKGLSLHSSLLVPVLTRYELPGAENSRSVVFNIGATKTF